MKSIQIAVLCMFASGADGAEQYRESAALGHVLVPRQLEITDQAIRGLEAPPGFQVTAAARGLGNPRMIAVSANGSVYITVPKSGEVVMLQESVLDGPEAKARTVVKNLKDVHGIAIRDNRLYLATVNAVYVADLLEDGSAGVPRVVVEDLGDGGQHKNRTIGFGPDGKLYVSVGSTCNACEELEGRHAVMLQFNPDGTGRHVYATGLRNTVGWAFHPETKEFWGMDHGSDWRGNDLPPEELNRIVSGGNFGWPFCFGKRRPDPMSHRSPEGKTIEDYCAETEPSVLEYQAHAAPIGMAFYTGSQFPAEYRGDAFVAMRGSWTRNPPSGYKVVRIRFDAGRPVKFSDFVTGFLAADGKAFLGRVAGVAVARDGSLLITDDTNGVLYRVQHKGDGNVTRSE